MTTLSHPHGSTEIPPDGGGFTSSSSVPARPNPDHSSPPGLAGQAEFRAPRRFFPFPRSLFGCAFSLKAIRCRCRGHPRSTQPLPATGLSDCALSLSDRTCASFVGGNPPPRLPRGIGLRVRGPSRTASFVPG